MIDVQKEELLRLHDVRRLQWFKGRNGGRVDIGTLRRWAAKGVRGVVLESVRIGTTTYTSVEAAIRFIQRLSAPLHVAPPLQQSALPRRRGISAANRRLDDAGIK